MTQCGACAHLGIDDTCALPSLQGLYEGSAGEGLSPEAADGLEGTACFLETLLAGLADSGRCPFWEAVEPGPCYTPMQPEHRKT